MHKQQLIARKRCFAFDFFYFLMLSLIFTIMTTTTNALTNNEPLSALKRYEALNYEDFSFSHSNNARRLNRRSNSLLNENKKDDDEDLVINSDDDSNAMRHLKFRAYNRTFNVRLRRETSFVSENIDIEIRYANETSKHLSDTFSSNFFVGQLDDEPNSFAICYFEERKKEEEEQSNTQPLVYLQIQVRNEANKTNTFYYVEPTTLNNTSKYVIYRSEDIASDLISNDVFK